jgi:hypothetical protein
VPDEPSNLNSPRRPVGNSRRRGRRGGRSRGPRPVGAKPGPTDAEEISPAGETVEPAAAPAGAAEHHEGAEHDEPETTGGFREPHAEAPAEFAAQGEESGEEAAHESVPEVTPAPEPRRDERRDFRREPRRDERRDERPQPPPRVPPAQRQWVKPADFRPAEETAIHEAVAHATFIANALKELHDQMDEVLELVEIAERQKLADEREIDELRRALRRIQPQNRPQPPAREPRREEPRRNEPRRDFCDQNQRRNEPQRPPPEPREPAAETPEPPPAGEGGEQPHTD